MFPVLIPDIPVPVSMSPEVDVRVEEELRATGERSLLKDGQAVVAGQLGKTNTEVRILVDTGATGCFINQAFVDLHQLTTQVHDNPLKLTLFDGQPSSAGEIKEYVEDCLQVIGLASKVKFDVTRLSGVDIVLGFSWLKLHRVVIDFGRLTIQAPEPTPLPQEREVAPDTSIDSDSVIDSNHATQATTVEPITQQIRASKKLRKKIYRKTNWRMFKKANKSISSPNNIPLGKPCVWNSGKHLTEAPTPDVESRLCAIADHFDDSETLPSFLDDFELTQEEIDDIKNQVPVHYHEYLEIFHPRLGTESLAPHRAYDMEIKLKPDAKLKIAPLYELSPLQTVALKETIDRERAAGRIRPSTSNYGSPCFFVPKKDGKFRMVVDFRTLNAATVPDVYPLPLINQTYIDLARAKFYTILDLVSAYQQCRIAKGYEHLTAFRTQFGMFESLVVRDGLRNAPAVFQHFLNELFADLILQGVVIVYIDDIIIACSSLEELRRITKIVFARLRDACLYIKASKCKFEVEEVKFLGVLISSAGVKADPGYVQGILDFPAPRDLKESRRFVGMAGYYRRFIPNFSKKLRPLTNLTVKGVPFEWGEAQEEGFQAVKKAMSEAPVIAHFNPAAETIVQADASVYGWGFVISQIDPASKLEHPVAIKSGSFTGAELNYQISEKEFFAIVAAFKKKRHLLIQVPVIVLTDHLNLTYWMEPRQLNPRQARWVDYLSGFDYKIVYRPGNKADFPDALSRNPIYSPDDDSEPTLVQALPNLDVSSSTSSKFTHFLRALVVRDNEVDEGIVDVKEIVEGIEEDDDLAQVRVVLAQDHAVPCSPECSNPLSTLNGFAKRLGFTNPTFKYSDKGLLMVDKKIYIPDHGDLRLHILKSCHDAALVGHQGVSKTLELIQRRLCWLGLRRDVEIYVRGCATCQRTKPSRQRPQGFLQSLEISDGPWTSISMDFVEELPASNGYNSILVVVDRLTKYATFIPTTTKLSTAGLVDLIVDNVVSRHGLPTSIISDRGSKFTSKLWAAMCKVLGIKVSLSTAFHPQTDGQTERVNQVMEQYLRQFTNYKQDNWSSLLQRAAFTYNNSLHSAINMTPFFANYGYHPRPMDGLDLGEEDTPAIVEKIKSIEEVHELCKRNINLANEDYAKYYNAKHREQDDFHVGDKVLLSLENITTRRPSKKMDIRFGGPFSILDKIGSRSYRLELSPSMKVHNVFHVSRLKRFHPPKFAGQQNDPPGPIEVDDSGESFEVSSIINSRINKKRLEYLVEWLGYEGTAEAATWQPARDLDGCQDLVDRFHKDNPAKPKPSDLMK
jgi:transposase InsO family protein